MGGADHNAKTDRMRFVSLIPVGEAELYVEEQGEGEVLLLVAGLGGSGAFWRAQVAHFSRRYRVITYDHRGGGGSPEAPLHSSVREMAGDALALMDALGIEATHVVGHSTGGAIGQHLALRAPERVRSLVLSSSWAGPTPLFVELFQLRRKILLEAGAESYLFSGTLLVTPAWAIEDSYPGREKIVAERLKVFPGVEAELGRLNAVMTHDLREEIHEIRVPTGVISAKDDVLTPPGMARELAERIPGARRVMLPEGGHFCTVTVADRYNGELDRLLRKISS